jgi:hypothetical protein
VLLLVDSSLDDLSVVGVGNQADNDGVLANLVLESGRVVDIEGDRVAVLEAFAELLGRVEGAAGWNDTSDGHCRWFSREAGSRYQQ